MSEDAAMQPSPAPDGWGQPIAEERRAYLYALAEQQRVWAEQPESDLAFSPLRAIRLSGADVFWLAARAVASSQDDIADAADRLRDPHQRYSLSLSTLHLEQANLFGAHLEQANISGSHLKGCHLYQAHLEGSFLEAAHLEGANLYGAHLEGAELSESHLEGSTLSHAHLERASATGAHLERANLIGAHLGRANLGATHLEGVDLREARMKRANLIGAHLEGALLIGADLEGGSLSDTHLEGADLSGVRLKKADLDWAHMEGKTYADGDPDFARIRQWGMDFSTTLPPADLRGAVCDAATDLAHITLGDARHGAVRVADMRWGGANLAVVDWTPLTELNARLGDEQAAWDWKPEPFKPPEGKPPEGKPPEGKPSRQEIRAAQAVHERMQRSARLEAFRAAVRANRQLATALRDQGLNEEADHFAYRAQVVQRAVFRQQGKRGRWFFSGFLDLIAGYGYQPLRSVGVYLLVIGVFALGYWLLGPVAGHTFAPDGALVFSLTSFHGRGFFPGGLDLENWITRLAALEAVLGLIIEISFIATFTQRFFGK